MVKRIFVLLVMDAICVADPQVNLPPVYPTMSNAAADDMAKAFAFCAAQELSVVLLTREYPELADELRKAQQQFQINFGPSVLAIDAILSKENSPWARDRERLVEKLSKDIVATKLSLEVAKASLRDVKERSEGKIISPILETLLIYHPSFLSEPHEEFTRGYRKKMDLSGHKKSPEVSVQINVPVSWSIKDADHPNIIGKATSENGRGNAMALVSVKPVPPGYEPTQKEIEELFQESGSEFLPDNYKAVAWKAITIEKLPGMKIEAESRESRMGVDYAGKSLIVMTYFKGKFISLYCTVVVPVDSMNELDKLYQKNEPLFSLIANSLVVKEKWLAP